MGLLVAPTCFDAATAPITNALTIRLIGSTADFSQRPNKSRNVNARPRGWGRAENRRFNHMLLHMRQALRCRAKSKRTGKPLGRIETVLQGGGCPAAC